MNSQVAMGSLAEAAGGGLLTDPNAIYIGLLKSRPVSDAIISQYQLQKVYHSRDMTAARKKLESRTSILSEASTLISITVIDADKNRAANLANSYTDQLRGLTTKISTTEASRRRQFFEEQVKVQKEKLVQAELAFQQVQQNKGVVHLESQATALIGGISMIRAQIAEKQVELQALRSYSTEQNPDVAMTERELATLRDEASRMEQQGGSDFSDLSLKDVPKAGLDYIRAQRELQFQQAFFDMLLRQYEAAKLDEARDAAVIQVVEAAIPPDRHSSPQRAMILIVATFIGLFVGCLYVLVLHRIELEEANAEGALAIRRLKFALSGGTRRKNSEM
jgi:capsule polysaccharide export protein KpsE/RkpR